jgi:hypothetical protein
VINKKLQYGFLMLACFRVFACKKALVTTAVLSNPKNQRKHDRQNPKQCDPLQFSIHFHSLVQDKENMKERTQNSVIHCSSASNSILWFRIKKSHNFLE